MAYNLGTVDSNRMLNPFAPPLQGMFFSLSFRKLQCLECLRIKVINGNDIALQSEEVDKERGVQCD